MIDKNKINLVLSDQGLDRKEDVYALNEFGKFVNRYVFSDQLISVDFWKYLKANFSIKDENITTYCDIVSDVKNNVEMVYKQIVKIEKPYHMLLVFYDEEKNSDNDSDESKNKITELIIYFDNDTKGYIKTIIDGIRKITYFPPKNKTFFIISSSAYGYDLEPATIKEYDIQLALNYGEAFVDKHKDILNKLKNNKHGLFLFHGEAGTGKTTYIRKLVSDLSEEKTIIYIPSYFMMDIASPELISFISKFKDSVLLLEDAESILTSPQEERTQAVTNILNISDGLLNDHMDMQIIATFNADKKVIDDALLRKGRMLVNYKFKRLTAEQANKLSKYIGLNKTYTEPKTLAEVYEEKIGKQLVDLETIGSHKKKIGFGN